MTPNITATIVTILLIWVLALTSDSFAAFLLGTIVWGTLFFFGTRFITKRINE